MIPFRQHKQPVPQLARSCRHAALVQLLGWSGVLACLPAGAQERIRTEVLASGLEHPWAVAFIDQGRLLVSERPGRLLLLQPGSKLRHPVAGLPEIDAGGQGGLHDVVADSGFAGNRTLYFCYAEPGSGGSSTALASARLSEDGQRLTQVKVLFSQRPKVASSAHFGCRIVEHRDGTLFLTLGDRYSRMEDAQRLDNHIGKIVRLRKDGSIPPDNPFANPASQAAGALAEIWSYGHRNGQGAAIGPDGHLWMHEHGPQGGDEINRVQAGGNYGWPVITYGEQYGGGKIGAGITSKAGMAQPLHYWVPSIAPSGMAFLKSGRYGKNWQGSLLIGALRSQDLRRIELQDGKIVREHKLLQQLGQRMRDVREGPDGLLYIVTDAARGQLLRLQPAP